MRDPKAALANYGFAAALSRDPAILRARAELYFDIGDYTAAIADYTAAIADYTAAIAANGAGPPDQGVLLLYANRAAAYSKLGMRPEEIQDLAKVVDQMGLLNAGDRGSCSRRRSTRSGWPAPITTSAISTTPRRPMASSIPRAWTGRTSMSSARSPNRRRSGTRRSTT